MQSLIGFDPTSPIVVYAYLVFTLTVALESIEVALPGETVLLTTAINVGATHQRGSARAPLLRHEAR